MQEQVNVIVIHWESFEINESKEFKEIIDKLNQPYDKGLYQIYGNHNSYGKDALLYIGLAEGQKFSQRLTNGERNVYDFFESMCQPTKLRIGRLCISEDDKENNSPLYKTQKYIENWKNNIIESERILIATHSPAYNKVIANKYSDMNYGDKLELLDKIKRPLREHYIIINKGDFGNLLPEVSTIRNSYCYYNFSDTYIGAELK